MVDTWYYTFVKTYSTMAQRVNLNVYIFLHHLKGQRISGIAADCDHKTLLCYKCKKHPH